MIDPIRLHREGLRALCRRFHVRRRDLSGSTARGDFDPEHSDIDFLVEFDRSAPQHPFDAYFGLEEPLEVLFGRPVDLVEAGAVRNPYLKASIDAGAGLRSVVGKARPGSARSSSTRLRSAMPCGAFARASSAASVSRRTSKSATG
jgi:predicted nucleotidyltransferase